MHEAKTNGWMGATPIVAVTAGVGQQRLMQGQQPSLHAAAWHPPPTRRCSCHAQLPTPLHSLAPACHSAADPHPVAGEMKSTRLSKWLNQFYDGKKCAAAIRVDASTDFSRLRVGQLRQMLQARGQVCSDCVEKDDYVRRVKQAYGLRA